VLHRGTQRCDAQSWYGDMLRSSCLCWLFRSHAALLHTRSCQSSSRTPSASVGVCTLCCAVGLAVSACRLSFSACRKLSYRPRMLVCVSPLRHRLKRLHLERLHTSRSTTASSDATPRGRRRRRVTPHLTVDDGATTSVCVGDGGWTGTESHLAHDSVKTARGRRERCQARPMTRRWRRH
jgi:hypothetical protein